MAADHIGTVARQLVFRRCPIFSSFAQITNMAPQLQKHTHVSVKKFVKIDEQKFEREARQLIFPKKPIVSKNEKNTSACIT